jgi:hypothetical protein
LPLLPLPRIVKRSMNLYAGFKREKQGCRGASPFRHPELVEGSFLFRARFGKRLN